MPYQLPGNHAKLSGQASLNKPFTLPSNASLEFTIDQKSYTINGIGGNYANSAELVDKINDIISNDAAFLFVSLVIVIVEFCMEDET